MALTITPNEISNKDFKRNFRGYDMDEVDIFLDALKDDYEKVLKLNSSLKEQIIVLKEKVEQYSNMENTLQNTLVLAQSAAQQAKENSEKEAGIVIKEAEREAQTLVSNAEKKVDDINKEYETIKNHFYQFKSRFKALISAQLETVEKLDIEESVRGTFSYKGKKEKDEKEFIKSDRVEKRDVPEAEKISEEATNIKKDIVNKNQSDAEDASKITSRMPSVKKSIKDEKENKEVPKKKVKKDDRDKPKPRPKRQTKQGKTEA